MTNKDGGITFAGSNNRYNSFQIDGVVMNDVFGLSSGGTNGGTDRCQPHFNGCYPGNASRSSSLRRTSERFYGWCYQRGNQAGYQRYACFSLYLLQQPKHVRQVQRTQRLQEDAHDAAVPPHLWRYPRRRNHQGQTLLLRKCRRQEGKLPLCCIPRLHASYITEATAKQIADKYNELTGFNENYGQRDIEQKSFGLLARVDWNINDQHKLALRYQHNDSFDDKYGSGSTSYRFNRSSYRQKNKTNSIVAELNSRFNDNLYDEFRASATFVRDEREVPYQGPTVRIMDIAGADGQSLLTANIGTDYSSGANKLDQDIYSFEDNLAWYKGDHTITFGTHNEFYRLKNLFIQASNGSWDYESLEDFMSDKPKSFTYKYTDPEVTGGNTKYAPVLKAGQFGFYAQDKWTVNRNFNATLGLRIDIPVTFNDPMVNPKFNEYSDKKGFGVHVGDMPGAKVLVSPRLGFNWYVDNEHRTLLRGGVGIFTGRVPFVWLSNAYNNTGMAMKGTTINRGDVPTLAKYGKNPMQAIKDNQGKGRADNPDIVTIDKDFKYPQVLRANLALEQMLPGDVKFTLEGVYSKTMNNVFFENLALENTGKQSYAVPGVQASAAPYYSNTKSDYYSIINLKNTNKGYTYSIAAQLEKRFAFGLDLSASYTFSRAKAVNDGKSSVASSNWKKNASVDSNSDKELGFSKFDTPHRILLQASYTSPKYLNGWMSTTIAVVYNGFSGSRYSLVMNDNRSTDFNGDSEAQTHSSISRRKMNCRR